MEDQASSHNFLSAIFGILGNFVIELGNKKIIETFFNENFFDHIIRCEKTSRFQKSHLENCAMKHVISRASDANLLLFFHEFETGSYLTW